MSHANSLFQAYFAFQGLQTNLATPGPPSWQGEEGIGMGLFLWLGHSVCFLQGFHVLGWGEGKEGPVGWAGVGCWIPPVVASFSQGLCTRQQVCAAGAD